MNELQRQELIREFEEIDDVDDVVKLYRKGWSLVEISNSKDFKIPGIIEALREQSVHIKPEHLEEAERYLELERASDSFMIRRIK
ncbi:hypothetical protein ABE430_20315 [Brevibacillus agri]|uniref:hypothetical protein n=1 Tax=Brevibacillus agri TaxID=51101 RepID=UPI003D208760